MESSQYSTPPFQVGFQWSHADGTCVGVRLPASGDVPADILNLHLSEKEQEAAHFMAPGRRISFVGGRIALRLALGIGKDFDLLSSSRGAPMLPKGTRGSVSHKKTWAIAWAGKALDEWQWGIDLEEIAKTRFDIAPRILTGAELYALRHLPEMERTRGVMFRFSAKEALYKALDAIVHRYVGFQEVEVDILPEGQAQARFFLKENPFECELTWRELDSHVVTFAKVRKPLSSGAL